MDPYNPSNPQNGPPVQHHYGRSALGAGLLVVAATAAGCSSSHISKTPATPSSSHSAVAAVATTTDPNGQMCMVTVTDSSGYCPGDSPSPTSTAPATGSLGTSFTVTTTDNNGNPVSYDVTLDSVKQHVYPGAYESPQTAGDHFAAAEFTITGGTGNTSDDANSDASALSADGTQYQPSFSVDSLPNFSSGEFNVSPGITVKGWVAFELPPGSSVGSVQWAPGLAGQAATWTVGG